MPIQHEQKRQLYVRYGDSHETFGRPAEFKGGDLDATITCTLPLTTEELKWLITLVDRLGQSMGTPGVSVFEDGIVRAQWHKDVPPPNDGQNWELKR